MCGVCKVWKMCDVCDVCEECEMGRVWKMCDVCDVCEECKVCGVWALGGVEWVRGVVAAGGHLGQSPELFVVECSSVQGHSGGVNVLDDKIVLALERG